MKTLGWLIGLGVFAALVPVGCSSSSSGGGTPNSGGNCVDISGTWYFSGGTCYEDAPSTCTVTQNGCSATAVCNDGNQAITVSGSSISFVTEGSNCSGQVQVGSTSGTCGQGSSQCTWSGTCTNGSCGAPKPSGGTGGASGAGGTGGGGTGTQCGDAKWSNDTACESCMQSSCCNELKNCSTGTACDQLFDCVGRNCGENITQECIGQYCSSELQSGGPALQALIQCNQSRCEDC
jgi:hypothetical protein